MGTFKVNVRCKKPECGEINVWELHEEDYGKQLMSLCKKCKQKITAKLPFREEYLKMEKASKEKNHITPTEVYNKEIGIEKSLKLKVLPNEWTSLQILQLSKTENIIGRATTVEGYEKADISIVTKDFQMSRRHLKIEKNVKGYIISDVGSKNNTYVNEKPLDQNEIYLRNGDELRLGRTILFVEIS